MLRLLPPSLLLPLLPSLPTISPSLLSRIRIDAQYSAHTARQEADVRAFSADEDLKLDVGMDYSSVRGLSDEVRERLGKVRPGSLVSAFCVFVKRGG